MSHTQPRARLPQAAPAPAAPQHPPPTSPHLTVSPEGPSSLSPAPSHRASPEPTPLTWSPSVVVCLARGQPPHPSPHPCPSPRPSQPPAQVGGLGGGTAPPSVSPCLGPRGGGHQLHIPRCPKKPRARMCSLHPATPAGGGCIPAFLKRILRLLSQEKGDLAREGV